MSSIKTTEDLEALCTKAAKEDFITVDTEFLSEKTYYAKLCLIQIGLSDMAVCIDPLMEGLDLAPLKKLLCKDKVLKVFHAAKSDMSIFLEAFGALPTPIFDTQVAAMVCGYGESISYAALVKDLVGINIDKTSQFTDWSRRPLSEAQVNYALSDVIHLRTVYKKLTESLASTGRTEWLEEEIKVLTDPETYRPDPLGLFEKIRVRNPNRQTLQVLKHLAAWREHWAQEKDLPRGRIVRDEVLVELAVQAPQDEEQFEKLRAFPKGLMNSRSFPSLVEAIKTAMAEPTEQWPRLPKRAKNPGLDTSAVQDLLKVLLKHVSEEHDVAARLVIDAEDMKRLASEEAPDIKALTGWRKKIFGDKAQALKKGKMAVRVDKFKLKFEEI